MTNLTPERRAELREYATEWLDVSAVNIFPDVLLALLDAADERDRLAAALARAQGPFACCSHCEGDAIHDVETNAHELPCTLCQSSIGEVERLRAERDRLAVQVERVRARLVPRPDDFDFDRDPHAHLPITEDADGLTCDICGAELADWAAADEHVDKEHTP